MLLDPGGWWWAYPLEKRGWGATFFLRSVRSMLSFDKLSMAAVKWRSFADPDRLCSPSLLSTPSAWWTGATVTPAVDKRTQSTQRHLLILIQDYCWDPEMKPIQEQKLFSIESMLCGIHQVNDRVVNWAKCILPQFAPRMNNRKVSGKLSWEGILVATSVRNCWDRGLDPCHHCTSAGEGDPGWKFGQI